MVSPVAWTLREVCTVQPLCRSIRFIGAGDCATASARRNENRESTGLIRVIRTLLMSFQALKAVLLYRLRLLHLVFVQNLWSGGDGWDASIPMRHTCALCCPRAPSGHAATHRAAEKRDELAAPHSITSSARASSVGGGARPSALAVLRLNGRMGRGAFAKTKTPRSQRRVSGTLIMGFGRLVEGQHFSSRPKTTLYSWAASLAVTQLKRGQSCLD